MVPVPQTNRVRQGSAHTFWTCDSRRPRSGPQQHQPGGDGRHVPLEPRQSPLTSPTGTQAPQLQDRGGAPSPLGADGGMQTVRGSHHGTGLPYHFLGGGGGHRVRNERARRAFHKRAKLLCAPTGIEGGIRLRQTLVRGAALGGAEAWQNTEAIFKAVNSTQLGQVRRMMHPGRRPGEEWADWNVRTRRGARVCTRTHVGHVGAHGKS